MMEHFLVCWIKSVLTPTIGEGEETNYDKKTKKLHIVKHELVLAARCSTDRRRSLLFPCFAYLRQKTCIYMVFIWWEHLENNFL